MTSARELSKLKGRVELRHLRCFLAVAEELHFARAAERLHIEQSPLSRAIKELEEVLDAKLFARTTRITRLTQAGKQFLEHVPKVFTALQRARDSVNAATGGFHGQLRIALSEGSTQARLPALLAQCRKHEPQIDIRLFEVPLPQLVKGLHDGAYDVGFAQSDDVGEGVLAESAWRDPIVVALPARHPLMVHERVPLREVLRYPVVMCDSVASEGNARQVAGMLRGGDHSPLVARQVTSLDLMMALVSAGFALGLAGASQFAARREEGVVSRPLAGQSPTLTTYLLRLEGQPAGTLARFIERVGFIEPADGVASAVRADVAALEENKP